MTVPDDADDALQAHRLGGGERRRVGREHALRDAVVIAQVDEEQLAVVALAMHPAGKPDGLPDVLRAQGRRTCASGSGLNDSTDSRGSRGQGRSVLGSGLRCIRASTYAAAPARGTVSCAPLRRSLMLTCRSPARRRQRSRRTGMCRGRGVLELLAELVRLRIHVHAQSAAPQLGRQRQRIARESSFQTSPSRPHGLARPPRGNICRSVITTMMRSRPSEKPQAGTSRPRNMPTRLS